MSIRQAAKLAGISDTRWRQIEQGWRMHRGRREEEPPAPAQTLARMAHAVAVTPAQLAGAGRPDAAAELAALPAASAPKLSYEQLLDSHRKLEEALARMRQQQSQQEEKDDGHRNAI
jgi:hypothetical protein